MLCKGGNINSHSQIQVFHECDADKTKSLEAFFIVMMKMVFDGRGKWGAPLFPVSQHLVCPLCGGEDLGLVLFGKISDAAQRTSIHGELG